MSTTSSVFPLSQAPLGATVRIEAVGDCARLSGRLYAMGLTPGSTATVDGCGCGQCRICIRGACLALGRGMAEKIQVSLLAPPGPAGPPASAGSIFPPGAPGACRHGNGAE